MRTTFCVLHLLQFIFVNQQVLLKNQFLIDQTLKVSSFLIQKPVKFVWFFEAMLKYVGIIFSNVSDFHSPQPFFENVTFPCQILSNWIFFLLLFYRRQNKRHFWFFHPYLWTFWPLSLALFNNFIFQVLRKQTSLKILSGKSIFFFNTREKLNFSSRFDFFFMLMQRKQSCYSSHTAISSFALSLQLFIPYISFLANSIL